MIIDLYFFYLYLVYSDNYDCRSNEFCDTTQSHSGFTGTCTTKHSGGISCTNDYQCIGICTNSSCVDPQPQGAVCTGTRKLRN
jgi:hypothetical protein